MITSTKTGILDKQNNCDRSHNYDNNDIFDKGRYYFCVSVT